MAAEQGKEVIKQGNRTRELKPLGITCTSTDCENGLHCFRRTRRMRTAGIHGPCRDCGVTLVDWERLVQRDVLDIDYTFEALQHELIRHHFWHVVIDLRAMNHARRKGRAGLREAAVNRIRKSVGSSNHPRQGRQTPFKGNVLFYAQHAVAACCRPCIEEWHAISRDRDLTAEEVFYLSELISKYVEKRIPELSEFGERIPSIRPNSTNHSTPEN